ncbi:DnaA ATPase domain-containing protein [Sphingobium nicotianae]|uniref:Chromosomal replication initiator DnaA n=1 Tax=Sphingobium nicotianae TaxID=2782607 RepID=A0A9X1IT59_9SPHN|nr:DnaA/Hda family protein [Sphingobium nicotianae]MBT2189361.1 chromosomal replication initiator DnaA [Sphingobium nicotianae]
MSQLPLPMAWSRRGGQELLIHGANAAAIAFLRDRLSWPSHCTVLVGPPKSGRTLIGEHFAAEAGATIVDDADRADEERLFHLWNEVRDSAGVLLLIATEPPPVWRIALPDLRTRLATAHVARINPPDEAIAAALIAHGLELAGSAFAPDVPEYLARRTPRCYEDIDAVVTRLNTLSLASGGKLSIASARQALCNKDDLDEAQGH